MKEKERPKMRKTSYFIHFEKYSYPGGQGTQSVADLAPSWSLYLPSGQASFCLEPRGQ